MKKIFFLGAVLIVFTCNVKAIKVNFAAFNMSVNVADGTTGILSYYQIYPDTYVSADSTDSIELVDFPQINYSDIVQIVIEKTLISAAPASFVPVATFSAPLDLAQGKYEDINFVQGDVYTYRLSVVNHLNQTFNLLLKTTETESANPNINCAKLNNVYRKACHNCFQDPIIPHGLGGFYLALSCTRVVELDIHKTSTNGKWDVRHSGSGSVNNCGIDMPSKLFSYGNVAFNECLSDINVWHNEHRNHDPIIVHIDLKSGFTVQHSTDMLDNLLASTFDVGAIYKPRDFVGSFDDMRVAAQRNNWPTLGDLTGKYIFVLTGDGERLSTYLREKGMDGYAFCAAKVTDLGDEISLSDIDNTPVDLRSQIVFYNMQQFNNVPFAPHDAELDIAKNRTSPNGYINRTYGINVSGEPASYSSSDFGRGIDFKINNIAVRNITERIKPPGSRPQNGVKENPEPALDNPELTDDHIYSSYANVTQTATQKIKANNLIVEPGAHYRMMAGQSIVLDDNIDMKLGSDVELKIEVCNPPVFPGLEKRAGGLTPEEIEDKIDALKSSLYAGMNVQNESGAGIKVYPNPATQLLNISYFSAVAGDAIFTLTDVLGKNVISYTNAGAGKGTQVFNIDVHQLTAGIYFYTLRTVNGSYNGKVTKLD